MTDDEAEGGEADAEIDADELIERVGDLLDRARETAESIPVVEDSESLHEALETVDDLQDIADEAEDILATLDVESLLDALEVGNATDAVSIEDLPEALAESDPEKAVEIRELLELADLPALLDSVNVREFWRQKRELDDEVDDVTDDESADGTDEDEYVSISVGDTDEDGDDAADGWGVSMPDIPNEGYENAIQSRMNDAVGEFREGLLEVHEHLAKMREANERRMEETRDDRTRSRNPTAVSTLRGRRVDTGSVGRHSTVPRETRHSTAPNRKRIYGSRFERDRDDAEDDS